MDRLRAVYQNVIVAPVEWVGDRVSQWVVRQVYGPEDPSSPPTSPEPSPPQPFYTPPSRPSSPVVSRTSPKRNSADDDPDAIPPARKVKRPRRPDSTDEFLAKLEEAIDRDEARQWTATWLKDTETDIDMLEKKVEELSAFVLFIERQKESGMEDLEISLEKNRMEVHKYEFELTTLGAQRDLLSHRLKQSKREMLELLRKIYEGSDAFLSSLREGERTGEGGRMADGTVVPIPFTSLLREAADCAIPLVTKAKHVKELEKEYLSMPNSPRSRVVTRRSNRKIGQKQKAWTNFRRAEKEYSQLAKHQDQREQDFLRHTARSFLIRTGRMFPVRKPSVASSTGDVVSFDPQPVLREVSPVPKLSEIRPGLQNVLQGRSEVGRWRGRLQNHRALYSERLARHLYANPNATKSQLDAIAMDELDGNTSKNREKALQETVNEAETYCAAARKRLEDFGARHLPLRPEWAGSFLDVAPSQASTQAPYIKPERLIRECHDIRRWNRDYARARPVTPIGSADGRACPCPRSTSHVLPDIQPVTPSNAWEVSSRPCTSTLNEQERKEWIQRVEEMRNYYRGRFMVPGGPIYENR